MTMPRDPYRVCLVGECLSTGGAERAMASLSRYFESVGIEVHIVIVVDSVVYPYAGRLLNLGKMKSPGWWNKLIRLRAMWRFLRRERFDFIIDFRVRPHFVQEWFIAHWLYNAPSIFTVHSTLPGWYVPESRYQAEAVYQDAYGMAAVSKSIAEKLRRDSGLKNVAVLHNPLDPDAITRLALEDAGKEGKFMLAAGRMDSDVKQFGELIETYARTALPENDVRLVILGDGAKRPLYQAKAKKLGMADKIVFPGSVENPYAFMSRALFFVLSSRREGFPTVVAESLACGTPVVSFDCDSGPREIIADEKNGLLVPDQDFAALGSAMEKMAFDEAFRRRCAAASKAGVSQLSLENVGRQWLAFLKIPVS